MAKPDASKEEMEEVLEKVNLLAFFKKNRMDYRLSCQNAGKTSQVVRDSVWHLQERCC